jgi:hypothetical protein
MTGLLAQGQDHAAPPSAPSQLIRLFGGLPLDSSAAVIEAWCLANSFTASKDTTYPYLGKFRKTTPGDSRFDKIPDSILTFLYFPHIRKPDSVGSHIPPLLSFTLIYGQDASGNARKEFRILEKLIRKWTGNSTRFATYDRKGDYYKEWKGYMSRMDNPENFPMLNLTYSVLNQQPDRTEVTVQYIRKTTR